MEQKKKPRKLRRVVTIAAVAIITFIINLFVSATVAIGYSFIYIARGVDLSDPDNLTQLVASNPSFLMLSSVYNLLAIAIVIVFWKYIDKQNTDRLGFARTNKTGIQVFWGIAAATAAIAAIIVFGLIFKVLRFQGMGFSVYSSTQMIMAMLTGIITFILVGFGEEAVYRSYIQNHLVDITDTRYGITIAALVFTGAHLFTYGKMLDLIDVFFGGLILGYAFILTKSIYLPAAYHFMWDFLQLNIFRLQDYEYYNGPVLFLFNNVGDLVINNYNLGNKLEIGFIAIEIMILSLMYIYREKISRLAGKKNT